MSVTATFSPPPAVGAPAALYVYSGNNQLTSTGTAFARPLAVLVTDSNGTPVPGTTVSFAAVPSAGGASAGLGAGTATTNSSGIATLTATPNATPGTYTVNATVSGVSSPATFTLTNVGPPASITYVNGGSSTDPQLAPINTQYAAPLVALVRDAAGNPIPSTTVTYTAVPASGASCTVSNGTSSGASVSATTDSSGMSSVTATANATVGAFTVTASVAGVIHAHERRRRDHPGAGGQPPDRYGGNGIRLAAAGPRPGRDWRRGARSGGHVPGARQRGDGDAERRLRLRPGRGGVHDGDDECVRDRERQRDGQLDLGTIRGRRVNAQRPDGGELRSHERLHRGLPVHGHHSHLRLVAPSVHRVHDDHAVQQQERLAAVVRRVGQLLRVHGRQPVQWLDPHLQPGDQ